MLLTQLNLSNSHHTQHSSMSHLASYEVLLLFFTQYYFGWMLRVLTPKLCFQHLKMTKSMTASCYLLTPRTDLQEVPIDNPDLIWFTDGSSLKDEQGHYLFYMQ